MATKTKSLKRSQFKKDLKALSLDKLKLQLSKLQAQIYEDRHNLILGKVKDIHLSLKHRRQVALCKTLIKQKQALEKSTKEAKDG